MSEHGSWAFTIQLETDPHVIRAVRKVIAATARIGGASDADARFIELSVGEALANARFHAYQNGVGPIEAVVTLDGEVFSVTIQNDGKPVTSGRAPDATGTTESLNWGLHVIGRVMDEVEITRSKLGDHGTAIRMSKRLTRNGGGIFEPRGLGSTNGRTGSRAKSDDGSRRAGVMINTPEESLGSGSVSREVRDLPGDRTGAHITEEERL